MISYKQWKQLNESMGIFPLGLSQKQNLGMVSNQPTISDGESVDEAGMTVKMPVGYMDAGMEPPMMKKKRPMFKHPSRDMEMGDEEERLGGEEEELGDEELGDEEEELGDEEEELGDEEEELGDEEELHPKKKRPPMLGAPHNSSAFMKKMKSECECEDEKPGTKKKIMIDKAEDDDEEKPKKKTDDDDGGDEEKPVFLKKGKKCKKMKEEYSRPKGYDPSEEAFLSSLKSQYGKVNEKFFDGVTEDALIMPPSEEPQPGEVGYAPQARVGGDYSPEQIAELLDRVDKLESKVS